MKLQKNIIILLKNLVNFIMIAIYKKKYDF